MSGTDPVYRTALFSGSYGLLTFNERFELQHFTGRDEHKEAALQEWFDHLREKLFPKPEQTCPECAHKLRVCLGCGRLWCS